MATHTIPITVFTGFLGAGKTTLVLSLLPQLPPGYKACLLKNEFGDVEVDSQLAKQSSLTGVNEILNGCMCCVLVGQMKNALLEIKERFQPDRIFVETSGSAFPATLAFQIRELERETDGAFKLDAIVTVIDAENFVGYEDTSPTARMQASYTDLIVINKWEQLSERKLDLVMDHLHTLNDLTPKIKCNGKNGVDPNLIFGLDSKLFQLEDSEQNVFVDAAHNDEVETVTLLRGSSSATPQTNECLDGNCSSHDHSHVLPLDGALPGLSQEYLDTALQKLSKESVWRVKGFVSLASPHGPHILNWAFGRHEWRKWEDTLDSDVKLTVMGERGEVRRLARKFAIELGAQMH